MLFQWGWRGVLIPGRGLPGAPLVCDSTQLGFTKPPALFLDITGPLALSREVSILTCRPDGKLRHVLSLGSTPKSQSVGNKSRSCLPPGSVGCLIWAQTLVARGLGPPWDWHSAEEQDKTGGVQGSPGASRYSRSLPSGPRSRARRVRRHVRGSRCGKAEA